jgi:hypothetical protein
MGKGIDDKEHIIIKRETRRRPVPALLSLFIGFGCHSKSEYMSCIINKENGERKKLLRAREITRVLSHDMLAASISRAGQSSLIKYRW